MVRRFLILSLLAVASAAAALADTAVDTMTGIFDPAFKTLQVTVDSDLMRPAVVGLDSDSRLEVEFDELADDRSYLRYRLVHCDSRWRPSSLVESEYVDGFNEAAVDDYEYSRGTATHYVHYRILLPNPDMRFLVSGNYLLQVYAEDDPDTVLLQVRFMVSEGAVAVRGRVTSRTDIDYNDAHQQLEIEVDASRYPIRDLYNDLFVVVAQNGRLDNAVGLRQPLRVSGQRAFYEHLRPLIFPAGTEYRRMETVSLYYPSMGVEDIQYYHPFYHHLLAPDTPRADLRYSFDQTQRGRFLVREYNSARSATEADYSVVHFTLLSPPIPDADVYLDGDFTLRRFDPDSRMVYDPDEQVYKKDLLLKQGAYNYQYLTLPRGESRGLTAPIEGDRFQTVNEYLILVYTRLPGDRYDRLVGATILLN